MLRKVMGKLPKSPATQKDLKQPVSVHCPASPFLKCCTVWPLHLQVSHSKLKRFWATHPVPSILERKTQLVYSHSSISSGDWFQDPPRIPKMHGCSSPLQLALHICGFYISGSAPQGTEGQLSHHLHNHWDDQSPWVEGNRDTIPI